MDDDKSCLSKDHDCDNDDYSDGNDEDVDDDDNDDDVGNDGNVAINPQLPEAPQL